MAPELLAGGGATAASDLYALGAMLFELLAGRRPHEAATLGALLRSVATKRAPDLRTIEPGLPEPAAALVAALLERDPAARPQDAADVARRLAALRRGIDAEDPASRG
jgi:serine/threonine-protein kinase